jgi:hypothetical protein
MVNSQAYLIVDRCWEGVEWIPSEPITAESANIWVASCDAEVIDSLLAAVVFRQRVWEARR